MVVYSPSVQVLKLKGQNKARLSRFFYHSMQCLYSIHEKMLRRKTKRTLYRVKLENSINM